MPKNKRLVRDLTRELWLMEELIGGLLVIWCFEVIV
jgi:hypothetical protein